MGGSDRHTEGKQKSSWSYSVKWDVIGNTNWQRERDESKKRKRDIEKV